jgi:hypothetical protein
MRTHSLEIKDNLQGIFITFEGLIFVEIPESILAKDALNVALLKPYESNFTNPLPVARDVVMIQMKENNPAPAAHTVRSQVEEVQNYTSVETLVRGLAHGSMVTSQGGLVVIKSGEFVVGIAERGDSGTLLHTKCHDGAWEAVAVFRGLSPSSNQHPTPRGIATLIISLKQFTSLDAVDLFQLYPNDIISCYVGTKDEYHKCKVESEAEAIGPRAVKLVFPNGALQIWRFCAHRKIDRVLWGKGMGHDEWIHAARSFDCWEA